MLGFRRYWTPKWSSFYGGVEKRWFLLASIFNYYNSRDAATLVPLIKKWIAPQTTVISDCWRSYQTLSAEGFQHLQINHSLHFVDPSNPTINKQNSQFGAMPESFSTHGRVKVHVPSNLARYMFTKAVRAKNCDPTEEFLKMAFFCIRIMCRQRMRKRNKTRKTATCLRKFELW